MVVKVVLKLSKLAKQSYMYKNSYLSSNGDFLLERIRPFMVLSTLHLATPIKPSILCYKISFYNVFITHFG